MAAERRSQAEQGVIDIFRDYYRRFAEAKGKSGHSFSVGARDKLVGGDYIFSADSFFTLIEFKWDNDGLYAERKKLIALRLCPALRQNNSMRQLAAKCHRIAWAEDGRVKLGAYFDVVCGGLTTLISAKVFCSQWFSPPPPHRASYEEFQTYIDWLLSLSNASQSELLMIGGNYVEDSDGLPDLFVGQFHGISELKDWLDENKPAHPGSDNDPRFEPW